MCTCHFKCSVIILCIWAFQISWWSWYQNEMWLTRSKEIESVIKYLLSKKPKNKWLLRWKFPTIQNNWWRSSSFKLHSWATVAWIPESNNYRARINPGIQRWFNKNKSMGAISFICRMKYKNPHDDLDTCKKARCACKH